MKGGFVYPSLAALSALFAACTPACTPPTPRLSFAVEQRILRETTLDDLPDEQAADGDAIVRVINSGAGTCSGALVGPRHILTAAHCVMEKGKHHEVTPVTPGHLHVELGGDYLPWGRVGVVALEVCDGYVGDAAHDLATLVLSKPVPPKVARYALAEPSRGLDERATFELGGFGSAVKPTQIPLTSWQILALDRHVLRGPLLYVDDQFLVLNITAVPGDSGGPIVDASTGKIVSVVSRGSVPSDSKATSKLVAGPRLATCQRAIDAMFRH